MDYISVTFYIFLLIAIVLYYIFPLKQRWIVLLSANIVFYAIAAREAIVVLILMAIFSWIWGQGICRLEKSSIKVSIKRLCLISGIVLIVCPLFITKYSAFFLGLIGKSTTWQFIIPLGISYYTLQIISYLVDIYKGKIEPESNLLKYTLYLSFFPQVVQGPIARYSQMKEQLCQGHVFEETKFVKGLHLIVWGFFLKMMIADKAAIIVNEIFSNYEMYVGWFVIIGGVLYSLQLYADFLACVTISQGVAGLFGIEVMDNFKHPYGATSVKEFWHRWHISLSTWLRDYVYIPLGGNRKGSLFKYFNLMCTFIVSGMWHGAGYKYILWGMLHGMYQIVEDITMPIRNLVWKISIFEKVKELRRYIEIFITFTCVMLAWIVFRADSLRAAIQMLINIFRVNNVWILFDGSLMKLGLSGKQIVVLCVSIGIMYLVSKLQQKICIRDYILKQNIIVRWGIYIGSILIVMVVGTYGYGFDAQAFIYGGF